MYSDKENVQGQSVKVIGVEIEGLTSPYLSARKIEIEARTFYATLLAFVIVSCTYLWVLQQ